jgi:hypothetical protein
MLVHTTMRASRRTELYSSLAEPATHLSHRGTAWGLFRECEAIYFLTNSITPELAALLEREELLIDQLPQEEQLRAYILDKTAERAKWRARFNVAATWPELEEYFAHAEELQDGQSLAFPKHLAVRYFPGYDYGLPFFDLLPLHANLMLSWSARIEWSLLEAKVFEDMAALSNQAERHHANPASLPEHQKERAALYRAASLNAINFVEAYINGVASDHYLAHLTQLDGPTKGLLLDWDFARNRPKFLTLKDKVLKYQRIILKSEHAPLQESNCPEFVYLITAAKSLRDALVHPAPDTLDHATPSKQQFLFTLTPEAARTTIDTAISIVRQLAKTLYGSQDRLFWLIDRSADGFFSGDTFA